MKRHEVSAVLSEACDERHECAGFGLILFMRSGAVMRLSDVIGLVDRAPYGEMPMLAASGANSGDIFVSCEAIDAIQIDWAPLKSDYNFRSFTMEMSE